MLSKANVKHINALNAKKYRQKYQQFKAEGNKLVSELLESSSPLYRLFATSDWLPAYESVVAAEQLNEVSEQEMRSVSNLQSPPGVLAIFGLPKYEGNASQSSWTLALDGMNDPGNMGTIIRTADWFGLDRIVCSEDCVDAFNPKVVQASMGSIARVQLDYLDLEKWIHEQPQTIWAASLEGNDIRNESTPDSGVLLIGSESHGIRFELDGLKQVRIPALGKAESLNAAVATGILMAHIKGMA